MGRQLKWWGWGVCVKKFICNFDRDTNGNGRATDQAVRALASHHTPSFSDLGKTACEIHN
jgi:hypothetical protein